MKKVLLILVIIMSVLPTSAQACKKAKQHKVDYGGKMFSFRNAKEKYYEGETVEFYFYMVATDTSYSFFLDGQPYNPSYQNDKGYIIRFVMPDHDVKIEVFSKNIMVLETPTIEREE